MSAFDLFVPMLTALGASVVFLGIAGALSLWKIEVARRVAQSVSPAVAFLFGAFLVRGFPPFPAAEAAGWIWWAVAAAAVAGVMPFGRAAWLRWVGRAVAIGFLLFLILRPLLGRSLEGREAFLWIAATALAWALGWAAIDQGRRAPRSWHPLLLLLMVSIGLSILLMVAGVASYSQYALALAGAIAGAGVWALPCVRRFLPDPRPSAAVVALPWVGLLVAGYFFAEMQWMDALFALVALLAFFLPLWPWSKKLRPLRLLLIQVGWVMLCFALAIVSAYSNAPKFDY